jgi:ribosomal protein L13
MKTLVAQALKNPDRKWYVIDAEGKNLGRLATGIARIVAGRDRVDLLHTLIMALTSLFSMLRRSL